jgi:hypothetical protein
MQKFKQHMFLKKVEKLLNTPAPKPENYDSTIDTAYVGATAPRTAGHFADSAVSMRHGQVKGIAELVGRAVGVLEGEVNGEGGDRDVEARLVEVEVKFQELDLGLLFTEQEEAERMATAAERRKAQASRVRAKSTNVSMAELEATKTRITQWQKEQLQHKRRLYKIENTVRDLGVNINDYRCRGLDRDRRAALASLNASTNEGVRMLRRVVGELEGI